MKEVLFIGLFRNDKDRERERGGEGGGGGRERKRERPKRLELLNSRVFNFLPLGEEFLSFYVFEIYLRRFV